MTTTVAARVSGEKREAGLEERYRALGRELDALKARALR